MTLPEPPLLIITDRRQASRPLDEVVRAALDAGCRWISVREKDLGPDDQIDLVRRIAARGHDCGAVVTVHGDPEIAARAGADGVHLPAGGSVDDARRILGPRALVGRSVHNGEEAETAERVKADYVVLGPIQWTASKPGYGPPLGLAGLREVARRVSVPVVALGGIEDAGTVRDCLNAGARAVAVMGAVMRAGDPGAVVRDLLNSAS